MNPYQLNATNNRNVIGHYILPTPNQAPLLVISGQPCPTSPVITMTNQNSSYMLPASQPVLQTQHSYIPQSQSQPQFHSQSQSQTRFHSQSQSQPQFHSQSQSDFQEESNIPSASELTDDDFESDEEDCPVCMMSKVRIALTIETTRIMTRN